MSNKRFLTGHRPKKKRESTIGYSSLCSMKSTFPLVVFGGCLPEAAGGCFSIRTTNDNRAHLKLDYEAISVKMLVQKNNVFQNNFWKYHYSGNSVYVFIIEIYVYKINNYLTDNWRNDRQSIIDALKNLGSWYSFNESQFPL